MVRTSRLKPPKKTRKTLHEVTREALINRPKPITLAQVAEATQTSESWLEKFQRNRIKDPGVNAIQRLYEFLFGHELNY